MHPGSRAGGRWISTAVLAVPMLALVSGFPQALLAKDTKQPPVARESATAEAAPPRPGASRDRIVAMAEQRYKAQVLRVEDAVDDGRRILILRLMSRKEGRVWSVRVDAETGKEL